MKGHLQVPAAFGHWLVAGNRLQCRMPRRLVTVRAPRPLLVSLMQLCDGSRSWAQVVDALSAKWTAEAVASFMRELAHESVLVESGQLWAHWSDIAQLPQPALSTATPEEIASLAQLAEDRLLPGEGCWTESVRSGTNPLAATLQRRESFRTFDDQPLPVQDLCSILWAAHGVASASDSDMLRWHRTVGSGGNMHSARWFVAVLRALPTTAPPHAPLAAGIYEARFHTGGGASLAPLASDPRAAWNCLRDPRVLRHASALLLPIWDVAVPARKYGNRATLFATLEAGLCLQNAQLMATSLGAAAMLRGDTVATAAMALAGLEPEDHQWLALPGMVLGAMPSTQQKKQQQVELQFRVAPNLHPGRRPGHPAAQFAFAASPADQPGQALLAGSGRSRDPATALRIAEAEAWERKAWASPGAGFEARLAELPQALDPRQLVAYTDHQHAAAGFPFQRVQPKRRRLWAEVLDAYTGAARAVPAECVHALHALPAACQAAACTSTSSSGVAAGTCLEDALARATLELVERDAFCCAWLRGEPPTGIDPLTLPGALRRRWDALVAQDVEASLVDLSTHWCVVTAVFLQSHAMPFTAITAAAGFDPEATLDKALSEAEGRLAFAQHLPARCGGDDAMRTIERYYRSRRTYRRSDFFRPTHGSLPLAHTGKGCARNWQEMRSRLQADGLDLLCADITPAGAAVDQGRQRLHVVRAIVPGLVPIWFHRGLQPQGLQRFSSACSGARGRPAGHFIHPFT